MRVQGAEDDATLQAVTVATDTVGANVDTTPFSSGLGLGYHSSRVTYVVSADTQLQMAEPHTAGMKLSRQISPAKH
jgi:hypothetical protein